MTAAVAQHLLEGKPITRIEAIVLYGMSNLTATITGLRRKGFLIKTRKVSYALALRRINQVTQLKPPKNLPIREIMFTEYQLQE